MGVALNYIYKHSGQTSGPRIMIFGVDVPIIG